jgi:hypothetical protein
VLGRNCWPVSSGKTSQHPDLTLLLGTWPLAVLLLVSSGVGGGPKGTLEYLVKSNDNADIVQLDDELKYIDFLNTC